MEKILLAIVAVALTTCSSLAYADVIKSDRHGWTVYEMTGEDVECVDAEMYPDGWDTLSDQIDLALIMVYPSYIEGLGNVSIGLFADGLTTDQATRSMQYAYVRESDQVCLIGLGYKYTST